MKKNKFHLLNFTNTNLLILLLLILSACSFSTVSPQNTSNFAAAGALNPSQTDLSDSSPLSPSPTFFLPVTNTPTPSPEPTATQTHTPEPTVCLYPQGNMQDFELKSDQVPYSLPVRIFFPACFSAHTSQTYPVLILLHGQTYDETQFDSLGAGKIAHELTSTQNVRPFLVVMPRETYFFQEPVDSYFDEQISNVLLPWLKENYPVSPTRNDWAIGGISRGGAWALRIGFKNWQSFGLIGGHSPVPFLADVYQVPYWLQEISAGEVPAVYMDIGQNDMFYTYANNFHQALVNYDAAHEWLVNEGAHTDSYWESHLKEYLEWYTFTWR